MLNSCDYLFKFYNNYYILLGFETVGVGEVIIVVIVLVVVLGVVVVIVVVVGVVVGIVE
jgi:hypothetical protein